MPLYENPDQHGADPIAYWLDTLAATKRIASASQTWPARFSAALTSRPRSKKQGLTQTTLLPT